MDGVLFSGKDCPFSHDEKAKATELKTRQASASDTVPEEGFKGFPKVPKDGKTVRWQQVITLGRELASWSGSDGGSDPSMILHSSSGSSFGSGSGSVVIYNSDFSSSSTDDALSVQDLVMNDTCG